MASVEKDSTSPQVRNDPAYRARRIATIEKNIIDAAQADKVVLVTVARLDSDIRDLAAKHNVDIHVGASPPDKGRRGVTFWYPAAQGTCRFCSNAVCSVPHGGIAQLRRCSCHVVEYCSTLCQRIDWPKHKPVCTWTKP